MPSEYDIAVGYFKELRKHFQDAFSDDFTLGKLYQGNTNYTYFSLANAELKKQKLKFVLVANLKPKQIEICLSGQNKKIRRNTWDLFHSSSWNKYQLADSIGDSLAIVSFIIAQNPDFKNGDVLKNHIVSQSFKFINDLSNILELNFKNA